MAVAECTSAIARVVPTARRVDELAVSSRTEAAARVLARRHARPRRSLAPGRFGAACGRRATALRHICDLTYATVNLELPRTVTLNCLLIATVLQFLAIPAFGMLSDVIGRRPVYLGGAAALAAFAFPFFWMVETTSPAWIYVAISVGLIAQSAMYAPQAALFPNCSGRMSGIRALRSGTSWPRRWPEA